MSNTVLDAVATPYDALPPTQPMSFPWLELDEEA